MDTLYVALGMLILLCAGMAVRAARLLHAALWLPPTPLARCPCCCTQPARTMSPFSPQAPADLYAHMDRPGAFCIA